MGSVTEYYIVPKKVYEECNAKEETLTQKIDKLPRTSQIKVKRLLDFLPENIKNENWSDPEKYSNSVFDYINYAIRGKNKPSDWESFLPNLVTAPQSFFCEKVKVELRKYKRKHGTKLH